MRLTRREAATIVSALLYYQQHSIDVVTSVHVPAPFNREAPLSQKEADALVERFVDQRLWDGGEE